MSPPFTQTILLVEDDEHDVLFMKMAWGKTGVVKGLQVAEDGQEAIDYLRGKDRFADRARYPIPALVLLDLKLPIVMGMDVLKWIRGQGELDTMVVIIMTSSQQKSDIHTAYSMGANSYLIKPGNPIDLGPMIELIQSYWLNLNQPSANFIVGKRVGVL